MPPVAQLLVPMLMQGLALMLVVRAKPGVLLGPLPVLVLNLLVALGVLLPVVPILEGLVMYHLSSLASQRF